MFYTLVSLMCFDTSNPLTCSLNVWKTETFPTKEACTAVGVTHVGAFTPFGVIVDFKCEPSGDPA